MRIRQRLSAYLIASLLSASPSNLRCEQAALHPGPVPAPPYRLVFSDEFDRLDLSPDGSGAHTWYEGVWFRRRHAPLKHISSSGSLLSLKWDSLQNSYDTSIATFSPLGKTHHSWRYGYFEARMTWDVVEGAWPAFWLIPVEDAQGLSTSAGTRHSGEIDVFEGQGNQPHTFFGTVHDWINLRSTANEANHFALSNRVDLSRFHVYGVLWTPGHISWYLDDRLLHSEAAPAILDTEELFMVFSMQQGVNWKLGNPPGVKRPEMTLNVDWVRVWQK